MTSIAKKLKNQERQVSLLSHFIGDFYQEKQVDDEWYIKMWNGGTNKWQVAVYSDKSYKNYKKFQGGGDINKLMQNAIEKAENDTFEQPTLESLKMKFNL